MAIRKDGPVAQLSLPAGFRFHPTDQELIVHYLTKKMAAEPFTQTIIAEIDLYKFNPWQLPEKSLIGEKEWYFFSPRDRKYPNGFRPNRSAGAGYWKATGTDKPICSEIGMKIGIKKALVFYIGKAPKGTKTNWIMHEYRLVEGNSAGASCSRASKRKAGGSLRMDEWVLCRLYKKAPGVQKAAAAAAAAAAVAAAGKPHEESASCMEELPVAHPEIGHDKFINNTPARIASLKQLRDQDKVNGMGFGDSPMADKLSRCGAGQAPSNDCTPWNNNKNSALPTTLIEFAQKESQHSNGVGIQVGSCRYAFDRPPKPPISPPINVDQLQCVGYNELLQYNDPCGAPLMFPQIALPVNNSTEQEVQSSFRHYHSENFDQYSQHRAFNYDNQGMQSTLTQLEPMAATLLNGASFLPGTEYFHRLQ